jgi:hypothetical protein
MTVEGYCADCRRVAQSYQSASTCEWRRNVLDEVVIVDDDGTVIGTRSTCESDVLPDESSTSPVSRDDWLAESQVAREEA